MAPGELGCQAGLARAWLGAHDHDTRTTFLPYRSELARQSLQLGLPIHELGSDAGGRASRGERRAGGASFVRGHRLRLALGLVHAPPAEPDRVSGAAPCAFLHQHCAGRRHVRQTRCRVDDVSDHGDPRRFRCRSDHHLAGVDARVDLRDRQSGSALVQLADTVADRERGAHGPFGVVFVRGGHAEERHEAVALDLGDRAAVVFDDALELGHRGPDERVDLLGVEGRGERRIPRQIGEQQGDELALPTSFSHCPPVPRRRHPCRSWPTPLCRLLQRPGDARSPSRACPRSSNRAPPGVGSVRSRGRLP